MTSDIWRKQDPQKPLFEDLIWSKPTNKLTSGKLLVIGGNANGFTAPALAYNQALGAGVGTVKVLLPMVLQKIVGKALPEAEFAPSNNSGSFSRQSLSSFMDLADWSDAVLLAGNFSSNSETSALLEDFLDRYQGAVTFSDDSLDVVINNPHAVLNRPQSLLVLDFNKLQKLLINSRFQMAIKSSLSIDAYVEILSEYTKRFKPMILTEFNGHIVVASQGKIVTTKAEPDLAELATKASVWWLQNPSKALEAISSAVVS